MYPLVWQLEREVLYVEDQFSDSIFFRKVGWSRARQNMSTDVWVFLVGCFDVGFWCRFLVFTCAVCFGHSRVSNHYFSWNFVYKSDYCPTEPALQTCTYGSLWYSQLAQEAMTPAFHGQIPQTQTTWRHGLCYKAFLAFGGWFSGVRAWFSTNISNLRIRSETKALQATIKSKSPQTIHQPSTQGSFSDHLDLMPTIPTQNSEASHLPFT